MRDLEEQVGQVWNPDIRPLVAEAYRCYVTGSARACITLTWVAVCADLIDKINRLAEDGEGAVAEMVKKVEKARSGGLDAAAVQTMQQVEHAILDKAFELELIDSIEKRELGRLREDRHLCAHPALRPLGEFYEPRLEYARTHLATALETVLTHPPSQGRKVIDRFKNLLADPSFVGGSDYLIHGFFDTVKPAVRRRLVDLAVKHAMLELLAPEPPGALVMADRMAECVHAFACRDRTLVHDAIAKVTERLLNTPMAAQIRALGRLGGLDVFWTAINEPTRSRFDAIVAGVFVPERTRLTDDYVRLLSLVACDEARRRLPALEAKFQALDVMHRAAIIAKSPGPYVARFVPGLLKDAPGFRMAESITEQAVIPCGPFLTVDLLRDALTEWADNNQCRIALKMLDLALDFYDATRHLRPADKPVWRAFIAKVRSMEDEDSAFRYAELEERVNADP